ncbi:ATP-dependent dethiobiotin synthetase BioD [Clostridium botulinum]|uniref:ATP-dependent dethiobiotin synthetase BioD n=2 Tax=Clostridium botulinum TaxID=1491 RepID=BIOD_CLOBM|nr:dethiobiotin synthase [Clostridium botulinum]B1KW07.1 RecName: Full=ATP-dependent dethiobiotin synthetase BioD; AltName: Full=DTB synthetase; Short=DTBS; AltName: Full=Dethiobiotin synthase [Clostridium botulinum A3 str. Loch Maree]ACA56773.1 dethiobiotin synthase [Clostridium botulinum A3 str. Loch Maree]NFH65444.1 ATP-dependent dethiobiotin synthetase BioD [Clostridium botulinum]NFJ09786.1 ATP-dependent dethiobiotin synthetase BioD [Clostridium botulinum]NFK14766.1 ATP-dependent dethiobio
MARGVFITATGTDIGKTYVTALIIKKLREVNINCGYYKAALSGAERIDSKLIAGDANYVYNIANIKGDPNDAVSYIFQQAVSPHLAAKLNNVEISMDKIKKDFSCIKNKYDYITVEGSGGIICPISMGKEKIMLENIVKSLKLPAIVIADAGLGTINNTILTLQYMKKKNIPIKMILLNNYNHENIIHIENKRYLSDNLSIPVYTCCKDSNNLEIPVERLIEFYEEI